MKIIGFYISGSISYAFLMEALLITIQTYKVLIISGAVFACSMIIIMAVVIDFGKKPLKKKLLKR